MVTLTIACLTLHAAAFTMGIPSGIRARSALNFAQMPQLRKGADRSQFVSTLRASSDGNSEV
jgi:hypothetical protein